MLRIIALAAALAATPSLAQTEHRQLARPDGSVIDYSIDMPAGDPEGVILLAQGSGCMPTAKNPNLSTVRSAFPGYIAVMVEKYGIAPDAAISDGFTDCASEFHAGYTVSQRVADYEVVLATELADRPLVLFGGSEGGLAVAMLAARVDAKATIILSSATGISFSEMVLSTVPPEGREQVRLGLAAAAADPEGTSLFAGSSHRFWADIMQHIPADYMLESATPFLVLQGGLDRSSPVAAARATADRFAAAKRCNLTYWEFPALDHGMVDPKGQSHMLSIASAAAVWTTSPLQWCQD
jgi:dipeptidyl aminopeptidase/acylaminoacyl peptidase